MILDMHTHIIPGVDDGASNIGEAFDLLRMLKAQGVDAVVATPHFYADMLNLEEYTQKVSELFAALKQGAKTQALPELLLGYEVHYFNNMSGCEELNKLSLNQSRYILIELPYTDINNWILDDIYNIQFNQGFIPIIAHIERYSKFKGFGNLLDMIANSDIQAQLNADSILSGPYKRVSLKLILNGICQYIASDAHSVSKRPPMIFEAYKRIEKKLGATISKRLYQYSQDLYNQLTQSVWV